jgi:hypothetical protein
VVHRIGNGEAVDVDFVIGQRVADLDECARAVGDEDGELFNAGDSGIGPSSASMLKGRACQRHGMARWMGYGKSH